MLKQFIGQLEKRVPIEPLLRACSDLFIKDRANHPKFHDSEFADLLRFIDDGEESYRAIAVQAAVKWSGSAQKVLLRNTILHRGLLTPSCLWAYIRLRGNSDELFKHYSSPELNLMQILLLKETGPERAIPFLIDHFLSRAQTSDELRVASELCIMSLLDADTSPEQLRSFRSRYRRVDVLQQWRPSIPARNENVEFSLRSKRIDFHELVRLVRDTAGLSSLTRSIYFLTLFYIPLTEKEWRSFWLAPTDQFFFERLRTIGIVESSNGGFLLSTDTAKQLMVSKFLYESYDLAKQSITQHRSQRIKEDRQRRVRNTELDRQALEMVPDGIICVDPYGYLYYMNPAAESLLKNDLLRETLFGNASLEESLRTYSKNDVLAKIKSCLPENGSSPEVFGNHIAITNGGKKFEVELGEQVILLRDVTDHYLIDNEIGRLYRHELKAELDVIAVGLNMARQLVSEGLSDELLVCLDQLEEKRAELCSMLEERIDFIRLHSDAFQIRGSLVNLNLIVDKCVTNYREAAAEKNISIESNHFDEPPITVLGEERFLSRALDNLIRNAVKFCRQKGEVRILMGIDADEAFVNVEDAGPGIAPEHLQKIFELGFTTGGSGRGLYIAKRIISAHRGRIDVRNRADNGACFTLRLPLNVGENL